VFERALSLVLIHFRAYRTYARNFLAGSMLLLVVECVLIGANLF
jgi:hypothetical protein